MPFELLLSFVMQLLSMPPREKRMITGNFHENRFGYRASRGFSLAWLLAFNEVVCVACQSHTGLFYTPSRGINKPTTVYTTDKPHERLRKCYKPCKRETSACRVRFGGPIEEWFLLLLLSIESNVVIGGPVLTKWYSHCLPEKKRSRLLSLSEVGCYRNGCCVESYFQKCMLMRIMLFMVDIAKCPLGLILT